MVLRDIKYWRIQRIKEQTFYKNVLYSFGILLHDLPRGGVGISFALSFLVKNNAYGIFSTSALTIIL